MNFIERGIYDLVKSNPRLKKGIRNLYQAAFDLLPRKRDYSINPISVSEGLFYGFHDIQPFSQDSSIILANRLRYDEPCMPKADDYIDVGYVTLDDARLGGFHPIGETNAWNYHKGCRLQWVDVNNVIYNRTVDGRLSAVIVNIHTAEERVVPAPIDTVSPDGRYATTFSYQRLETHMPGYGYCHSDESFLSKKAPSETGLFLVDLLSGERSLLVDLASLAALTERSEASGVSNHYVTHSEFSHDGRYISFLHRWTGEYKSKRYTEFMLFDRKTGALRRLPTTGHMTSHYVWNGRREILAYCNFEGVDSHVLFNVEAPSLNRRVAYPTLNSDGHQSFIADRAFVTDSYPDKYRMAKLWKVDIEEESAELLASVYSPRKYQSSPQKGHVACDLHPRVSPDGRFVCFDTVHSGRRALAVMAID